MQYSAVKYSTLKYSTVQYSTVKYSTVQYSSVYLSTLIKTLSIVYFWKSQVEFSLMKMTPTIMITIRTSSKYREVPDNYFSLNTPYVAE